MITLIAIKKGKNFIFPSTRCIDKELVYEMMKNSNTIQHYVYHSLVDYMNPRSNPTLSATMLAVLL